MFHTSFKLVSLLLLPLLWGCLSQKNEATTSAQTADEEPAMVPTSALMITQTVEDYDTWRASFFESGILDKKNGMLSRTAYRSMNDSNLVVVTCFTSSHEAAKNLASNETVMGKMDSSGVLQSRFSYWDIAWTRPGGNYPDFEGYYFIEHPVADSEIWLEKFQAHDSVRLKNGLYALLVASNADSTGLIGMYFGIADLLKAKTLLSDPEMARVQQEAGVLQAPAVTLVSMQ